MSTNQVLVLVAVGIAIGAALLWPLLRGKAPPPARGASAAQRPLAMAPEVDELAELEMDRAMGRISDADYQRLRAKVESGAVAPPATVEARVVAPMAAPAAAAVAPAPVAPGTADAEALVRHWRSMPRPACSRCGERPEAGARFCSNCGTSLA